MFNIRHTVPWSGSVLVACAALAGCAPKTNVSAAGNVPAQYSHVFMSVQAIWFNTSATAGPDDTAWIKFTLTTPVTVDLVSSVDGTLDTITTGLSIPVGTYAQVRLIPVVDSTATLLTSASALHAVYNSEVDYVDSAGKPQTLQLELQNPDKGIGIATTLKVTGSTKSTSSGTSTLTPVSLAIKIDGARDLVPFTYSTSTLPGVLLNPHATAYDASTVGAVKGTLTLSGLTAIASTNTASAYDDIQVTAESLSADGTRHVAVNSAPVRASDGTFTLYPLPTSSSSPTSYDLVIHGPGIATVIIKAVPVSVGDPTSASTTPVSIGTIVPRPATSFTVNVSATTPLPAGALVGFYQTLSGTGEVPYLIEERPIDPFSRTFATDQAISDATLYLGTFVAGSDVTLAATTPTEGASTYRASATAPLFADGLLTTTVSPTTIPVAVPAPTVASGSALYSVSLAITETTRNKYNQGELIISHDGAIVSTAALDTVLAQNGGTLTISGLPGGSSSATFDSGLYYVSVRTWNTGTLNTTIPPTLNREIYPRALDMRNGNVTGYALNID